MSLEGIQNEQSRLDTLDNKADRKILVVEGKEAELTQTFIGKTDKLLMSLNELDQEDPLKQEVAQDVFRLLSDVDVMNLEERQANFRTVTDQYIESVEKKGGIRDRVLNLEMNAWGEMTQGNWFETAYKKALENGTGITEEKVTALENYTQQTKDMADQYQQLASYFTQESDLSPDSNQFLQSFINPEVITGILDGSIASPDNLIQKFAVLNNELKEKKEKCEKLTSTLKETASKSGGEVLQAMAEDHEQVLEIYSVLIEKKGVPIRTIGQVLQTLAGTQEFKDMASQGWENPQEAKRFVIEAVLRGKTKEGEKESVDQNEVEKIQAELYAENLFRQQQAVLDAKFQEQAAKADQNQKEIDLFKQKYTSDNGYLYKNCLLKKSVSSQVVDRETGETKTVNEQGNFSALMNMERNLAVAQANALKTQIDQTRNSAKFTMALSVIHQNGDRSLAKMKESARKLFETREGENFKANFERVKTEFADTNIQNTTGQLSEIERLRSEYLIAKLAAEEKDAISHSENLLKGELMYRQMLEGADPIENDVVKQAVIKRKETKSEEISKGLETLTKSLKNEFSVISKAIDKYGSIDLVPQDEKPSIADKAMTLLSILGTSMNYMSQLKTLDIEIKLLDPSKGMGKETQGGLNQDYYFQQNFFKEVSAFMGNETEMPDMDIASPEVQALILGELNGKISSNVGSAINNVVASSQDAAIYMQQTLPAKIELRQKFGRGKMDLLNTGIGKFDNMINSINQGRAQLLQTKDDLQSSAMDNSGIFKEHPELKPLREKLIAKLLKGIDNLLNAQFSENQIKEAEKAKSALQDIKDDITWNIIKMAAVFTLSVAAAMITGGLAGVAAGRVCSALVMGIRTTNIVKFAASNIGMAAGVTVGQRGATHAVNLLPGTEWEVDWSAKSMAMDFGRNIALSVGFTGGGALLGKELAKRAVIKTGGKYTYAELTEAGLTKFGFIQRITSPIKITEDFVKEGIKGAFKKSTAKFLEEVAQETMEEMAESIHPVLGGIASMANAATGGPNIDINIKQRFGKKLQEIGVQLNESTRRLEFQQNSASDFGADLMAHLGDARHEVEFSVNQDNTFSLRIMGTDQTITIHQSEEITAQQQIGRLSEESKWYREQGVKNTETEERIGVLESEIEEELKGLKTNTDEYHEKHFEILNRRLRENKEKNRDNPKELIQGYKDIQRVIGKNYPKKLKQLQSDFYGARLELSKSTIQQIQEGTIETTKAKSILKKSNVKVESGETEQMAIKRWLEQKNTAIEEQKAILRGIVDPEIEQMIMLGHLYGHISRAEINLDSHLQHRQKLLQTTKQLSSNSETQTLLKKHASQLMEHIDSRSHPLSTDQKILIQKLTNDLVDTAAQTEMSVDQATQLVEDTVEKLIYQTVETTKRQLGDHGIRHISGNIKVADQLMQKLESAGHKFTKQDKLLMMVTHINHDMGYTVGLGRFGFDGTKLHDLTGEMIIDNQRESFEGILSPERFAQMQRLIRDHDGTEMIFDSENTMDTLGSVVRISDNMALFANEKLPEVFARDMQALKILGLIQLARDSKIDERSTIVQELKENLRGIIINKRREGEISRAEEINLTKAVDEIFHSSGKFTLGMTGGRYGGDLFQVGIGEDGKTIIDIRLEKSESQKTLSETFEKEQKLEAVQFLKMVNDYRQEFGLEKIDLEEFQRMSDTKEGLVIDTGQGIMRIKVRETASKETKSSDTLRKRGSEIQKELSDLRPKIQEDPANKSLMNKYEQLLVERSQIYETIAMREVRYAGDEYFKIVKGANGLHTQEIESMSQMTQEKFVQMGPEQKAEIAEKLKHFMRAINAGPKGLQGISIQKIMRQGLGIDPASGNVIEAGNYEVFKTEIDEVLNIQSHLNGYLLKDLAKRTLS